MVIFPISSTSHVVSTLRVWATRATLPTGYSPCLFAITSSTFFAQDVDTYQPLYWSLNERTQAEREGKVSGSLSMRRTLAANRFGSLCIGCKITCPNMPSTLGVAAPYCLPKSNHYRGISSLPPQNYERAKAALCSEAGSALEGQGDIERDDIPQSWGALGCLSANAQSLGPQRED